MQHKHTYSVFVLREKGAPIAPCVLPVFAFTSLATTFPLSYGNGEGSETTHILGTFASGVRVSVLPILTSILFFALFRAHLCPPLSRLS
jgi:hypothetical protein